LEDVYFIYLKGHAELIQQRLMARRGHFMPPELLASQFDTLEEPEDALTVDIAQSPDQIVQYIRCALAL
jgi:gluconokinase